MSHRSRRQSPNPAASDHLEKVRNFLGLLLVAFVGVLNFVGLSNDEVSNVLRNDATLATFVAILLFGALATAMASVFVTSGPRGQKVSQLRAWGVVALAFAIAPLSVALIGIPNRTSDADFNCSIGISSALALVGLILLALPFLPKVSAPAKASWELVLLTCALVLTSTAAYAAVRLETKSVVEATWPQMAASIKADGATGEVSASVSASKLSRDDKIGVLIRGIPRATSLSAECGLRRVVECVNKLCKAYPKDPCKHIASGALQPDATGAIKEKAFSTLFSLSLYQLVEVRATVCASAAFPEPKPSQSKSQSPSHSSTSSPGSSSPSTSKKPKSRKKYCHYDDEKTAVAYLGVPPPANN